jgi:actin related protein 2/3 complex subunit 2
MLFLDAENQLILNVIKNRIDTEKLERLKNLLEIKAQEFDGTHYTITGSGLESKDNLDSQSETITVSIHLLCGEVLTKYGLDDYLKGVYGSWYRTPEANFTATVAFGIENLDEKEVAKVLNLVPLLKRFVMMAPFAHAFDLFLKNKSFEPIHLPYRHEENIYIIYYEKEKSLVVVYSIKFDDDDDKELGRIFLQEFKDSRRDKELGSAPSVSFTQGTKPLELTNIKSKEPDDKEGGLKNYGFVSFSLRDSHCTEEKRHSTVDKLLQFRNYFHYHIKCSKAYMHIRMRGRCAKLQEELELAKDKAGISVKAKTFQGKTFERE